MTVHRSLVIVLMLITAMLIAYTFQRPTALMEGQIFRYVYVFDISQSMNVTDATLSDDGVSRLEFAKRAAVKSLSSLPCDSEVGVALFSGHRVFLLITPIEICANYTELSTILNQLDWRMTWERSSEVAKGVYKSLGLLSVLDKKTRLVFFTDGHESPPIRPELPPRFTGSIGEVAGIVIGVGGIDAVEIPKFDEAGNRIGVWTKDDVVQGYQSGDASPNAGTEHLSSLREPYIRQIAEDVGLQYYRLTDIDEFTQHIERQVLGITKSSITDIRWVVACLALAMLLLSVIVKPRLSDS